MCNFKVELEELNVDAAIHMGAKPEAAFNGFIANTLDALLVFEGEHVLFWHKSQGRMDACERALRQSMGIFPLACAPLSKQPACRRGILPRTQTRLSEAQRKAIKSGDVFVFSEEESKIKR